MVYPLISIDLFKKIGESSVLLSQDVSTKSCISEIVEQSCPNLRTTIYSISHAAIDVYSVQRYDEMGTSCY